MNTSNHKNALKLILLLFAAISGWGFLILEKMQITITIGTPDVTLVGTPTASSFTSALPSEPDLGVLSPTSMPTVTPIITTVPTEIVILIPTQLNPTELAGNDHVSNNAPSNSQTNNSVSSNNPAGNNSSEADEDPVYIPAPLSAIPVRQRPTPVMPTPIPAIILSAVEKPTEVLPPLVKGPTAEVTPVPSCPGCIAD